MQLGPVGIAAGLAEEFDFAGAGREAAGERAEERSLARAVRAEDDPVLAALHAPVEPIQDARAVAMDAEAASVEDMGLGEGTVWLWRHRFAEKRREGLKDHPKCPPPRLYYAEIQARLLVLACQKPSEVDPTRTGQTHWSINDLAQFVADHPELGLGSPSKSTIGVILKRHQVRLDRL